MKVKEELGNVYSQLVTSDFYLVLGVFIINILRISGVCGYKRIVFAFIICSIFAISDELHQLLVSGRAGQVEDVIIDTVGASVGISVYLIATRFVHFTSKFCKVSERTVKKKCPF
jgi:VanZ family protein